MRLRRPSGVDLREDLLVGREAVRLLVGVGGLAVDGDFEDPAHTFFEAGGETVPALDGGLQTGGLGQVVSLPAVQDLDVHLVSSPLMFAVSYHAALGWADRGDGFAQP